MKAALMQKLRPSREVQLHQATSKNVFGIDRNRGIVLGAFVQFAKHTEVRMPLPSIWGVYVW